LVELRSRHDVASFRRIQADVTSLAARDILAALRGLAPQPATPAGRVALARLLQWDGTMAADRPEPLLFHAWLRRLRHRVFADDLGGAQDMAAGSELTRATLRVLRGETRARDWCDDRDTPNTREGCAQIAAEALDEAMAELGRDSGRDILGLRWDDAHRAVHEHRSFSAGGVPAGLVRTRGARPGRQLHRQRRPARPAGRRRLACTLRDPARSQPARDLRSRARPDR
jgi:penicillin amidase